MTKTEAVSWTTKSHRQYSKMILASIADAYSLMIGRDGSSNVSIEESKLWLNSGEKFQNTNDKSRCNSLKRIVDLFRKYDTDNSQALDRKQFSILFIDVGGREQNLERFRLMISSECYGYKWNVQHVLLISGTYLIISQVLKLKFVKINERGRGRVLIRSGDR